MDNVCSEPTQRDPRRRIGTRSVFSASDSTCEARKRQSGRILDSTTHAQRNAIADILTSSRCIRSLYSFMLKCNGLHEKSISTVPADGLKVAADGMHSTKAHHSFSRQYHMRIVRKIAKSAQQPWTRKAVNGTYQCLNLEALFKSQLPTCNIRRANAESRKLAEPAQHADEAVVTDRAPTATQEYLEPAILSTSVRSNDTLRQSYITLTCISRCRLPSRTVAQLSALVLLYIQCGRRRPVSYLQLCWCHKQQWRMCFCMDRKRLCCSHRL